MYDLQRFLDAQEKIYETALTEIRAGLKKSHWMWFVFPQLKGLGRSGDAEYYGIADVTEAKEYLRHPVLGARLREITEELLNIESTDALYIMGYPDNLKLKSCMTLFLLASRDYLFQRVLDKFFDSELCEHTLDMLV